MRILFSFSPLGLLALFLLALRLPAAAQAPAWQSARAVAAATAAGGTDSQVKATAVDVAGNVYLAGYFKNMVVLGSTTLTSLGGSDVFVAKFNPASNQFVWAQRAGGTGDDEAAALAVSGTSVYVAGYFTSSMADFGTAALASVGPSDLFVAKLSDAGSTGDFVWAQQAGGTSVDAAFALAAGGTSVYVAGYFSNSTASFGPITLTNAGYKDAFVAKLTDAGNTSSFVWAQQVGGTGNDQVNALAVSGSSVYAAGYFGATASFGANTLTSAGGSDVFVAKLTDMGGTTSFAWSQRAGGTADDEAKALAVRGPSVYVAGAFQSPAASFGSVTLANATNRGLPDVFVTRLTERGSFIWAQQAGGTGYDYASALAVNGTSVYVAGRFQSPAASFGSTTLTDTGGGDVFVSKLIDVGSTASFAWVQQAGGTGEEYTTALAVSGTGVYVTGYFQSAVASFGTITLANSNPNAPLGFLASLADPTLTATATGHALPPAQLYPNPAYHTASLRLPTGTAPAPLTLSDALGRTVRRYPAPAGSEATLDLRGLSTGLYMLQGAGPAQRLQVE